MDDAYVASVLTNASFIRAAAAALSVLLIIVLADVQRNGTHLTLNYFLSCMHVGPFVLSFLLAALACNLLERWRHSVAVLLFVLLLLAIVSRTDYSLLDLRCR